MSIPVRSGLGRSGLGRSGSGSFGAIHLGFLPRFPIGESPFLTRSIFLFNEEFHLFFTELSVRPGSSWAIFAHLFPHSLRFSMIILSSCSVHGECERVGDKLFTQRSRHCLPRRPGSKAARSVQLCGPCSSTHFTIVSSSSSRHEPFTRAGLRTLVHRSVTCCADLPGKLCVTISSSIDRDIRSRRSVSSCSLQLDADTELMRLRARVGAFVDREGELSIRVKPLPTQTGVDPSLFHTNILFPITRA